MECKLFVCICIFLEIAMSIQISIHIQKSYYDALYTSESDSYKHVFIILGAYLLDVVQDTPTTALVVEHEVDWVIVQSVSCDVVVLLLH